MMAMTIELTPIEVNNAIEMVDFDTFGMMPSAASHAKSYGNFFQWATQIYGAWANDVRTGAYPEDKHGYHMDEAELDKFLNMLEHA